MRIENMTSNKTVIPFLAFGLVFFFALFSSIGNATLDQGYSILNSANAADEEEGMRGVSCPVRLKLVKKKYEFYKCPDSEHDKCEGLKKSLDKLNEKCGEKTE